MLNLGLLVIRIVVGLVVAAHGAQKLFGWFEGPRIAGFSGMLNSLGVRPSRPWAMVASIAEFAGGLLVVVGLLTPIAALAVCGSMLVAILLVHVPKGFWNRNGGYEFPLVILGSMVGLSLIGPGAYSLDSLLRIGLPEPATWVVVAALTVLGVAFAWASPRLDRARQTRTIAG